MARLQNFNYGGNFINALRAGQQDRRQQQFQDFRQNLMQQQQDFKEAQAPIQNALESRRIGVSERNTSVSESEQQMAGLEYLGKVANNLMKYDDQMLPRAYAGMKTQLEQITGQQLPENITRQELQQFSALVEQEKQRWGAPKAVMQNGQRVLAQFDDQGEYRVVPGIQPDKRSGTSLRVNPETGEVVFSQGGNVPVEEVSKSNTNKIQKSILDAERGLMELGRIAGNYQDEYLTYGGRAKSAIGGFLDKTGLGFGEDLQQFNAQRAKFTTGMRQFFNQYRREITGAAASVQEMQDLLKSMMNENMGPDEFRAVYDEFVQKAKANIELNKQQLGYSDKPAQQGVPQIPARNQQQSAQPSNQSDTNKMSIEELTNYYDSE